MARKIPGRRRERNIYNHYTYGFYAHSFSSLWSRRLEACELYLQRKNGELTDLPLHAQDGSGKAQEHLTNVACIGNLLRAWHSRRESGNHTSELHEAARHVSCYSLLSMWTHMYVIQRTPHFLQGTDYWCQQYSTRWMVSLKLYESTDKLFRSD